MLKVSHEAMFHVVDVLHSVDFNKWVADFTGRNVVNKKHAPNQN